MKEKQTERTQNMDLVTGIKERRFAADNEATSDLATNAANIKGVTSSGAFPFFYAHTDSL